MTDEPARVSVIIPCYNHGRFLAEAIESVLAQTTRAFEIIVIDDGSTDDSGLVARRYPRVRCIRQPNRGVAAARNAGLAASGGELIVFLDADDRLLPAALEAGVRELGAHPAWALAVGRSRFIAADGTPLPGPEPRPLGPEPYLTLLWRNIIRMPAMVMFRRRALEAVGGFRYGVDACADYDLYLRIARTMPVGSHDELVAEYRRHSQNMSLDPRLMLMQGLEVVLSQRSFDGRDPVCWAACKQGYRNLQDYYGDRIANRIRENFRSRRRWLTVLADGFVLVWLHPGGALEHLCRKLRLQMPLIGPRQRPAAVRPAPQTDQSVRPATSACPPPDDRGSSASETFRAAPRVRVADAPPSGR